MKYGIELEFFVGQATTGDPVIAPAFKYTDNTDGNPVVGELRTGVHNSIIDCVFELRKLLFIEEEKLKKAGMELLLTPTIKVNGDFLKALRRDKTYVNRKVLDVLDEYSIYPGGEVGKEIPREQYKAALQINFSENDTFSYPTYNDRGKWEKTENKLISKPFNFIPIIAKGDEAFRADIERTERVKGVFTIKPGTHGDRIEYRSLPNDVNLLKVMETYR